MSVGCCYLLVFPNGKGYVGETEKTMDERLRGHHAALRNIRFKNKLLNGWRKHGEPDIIVLATGLNDTPERKAREVEFIAYYNTYRNGYNSTPGGEMSPMKVPEIAAKFIGRRSPSKRPEVRARISASKRTSESTLAHLARLHAPGGCPKLDAWRTSPENRAHLAVRSASPENRAHLARLNADPEKTERRLAGIAVRRASEEGKAQLAEAQLIAAYNKNARAAAALTIEVNALNDRACDWG